MPTVLRLDGLRVMIYTDDHGPPHVHVVGSQGRAVFLLNCPEGLPTLRGPATMSRQEASRIGKELAAHTAALCAHRRTIHGDH